MGVGHYENFPVASLLAPPALRDAIRAIYRFARTADDIADEGNAPPAERLRGLAELRGALDAIDAGAAGDWPDLARAVRTHALPTPLLRDLLSAFEQDVVTSRYASFESLLDYCRRSANPIGRLLLVLYGRSDASVAKRGPMRSARRCSSRTSGRTSPSTGTRGASTSQPKTWSASPSVSRTWPRVL